MDEETSICLTPYNLSDFEEIDGWDGFISPEGSFYKVSKRNFFNSNHDNFAEIFASIVHKWI